MPTSFRLGSESALESSTVHSRTSRLGDELAAGQCQGGLFHHVDSVCDIAERQAYLEIRIARALARCGDQSGTATLHRYLHDSRRPLARHAQRALAAAGDPEH